MPGHNHYSSCTCGWCSGGGGGGRSISVAVAPEPLPAAGTRSTWECDGFCRPTRCPLCGAQVYFVRHNGGSVWFDDLGPPWPKHGCFEEEILSIRLREVLAAESGRTANPVFGVITETVVIDPGNSGRIVAKCSDDAVVDDIFQTEWNLPKCAGALILISRIKADRFNVHRISDYYPTLWRPKLRLSVGARIVFQNRAYLWDGQEWYGATDNMLAPLGMQQRLTLAAAERVKAMQLTIDGADCYSPP